MSGFDLLSKENWFPALSLTVISALCVLNMWFIGRLIASIDAASKGVSLLMVDVKVMQVQIALLMKSVFESEKE